MSLLLAVVFNCLSVLPFYRSQADDNTIDAIYGADVGRIELADFAQSRASEHRDQRHPEARIAGALVADFVVATSPSAQPR